MRVRDIIARSVTMLVAVPGVAAACTLAKGVDVQQFRAHMDRPAHLSWTLSALSVLVWYLLPELRARSARVSCLLIGATLLQPAWWYSTSGDCGHMRSALAAVVGAGSFVTLVLAVVSWRRSPRITVTGAESR